VLAGLREDAISDRERLVAGVDVTAEPSHGHRLSRLPHLTLEMMVALVIVAVVVIGASLR
jgi:hypothetical protein